MLKYFHTFLALPPFYDVYGFDVCCRERGEEEHGRPYNGFIYIYTYIHNWLTLYQTCLYNGYTHEMHTLFPFPV